MTVTTLSAVGVLSLGVLSACGTTEKPSPPLTQPTATQQTTSAPATPETAADLVGDWSAPEAEWTVHFADDGTYTMDYDGVEEFTSGKYELTDGRVKLIGGDGETDEGAVEGPTLVFQLGTLKPVPTK